ncbi:MAG: MFS transporter [Gemmatimonadales bacterium]|nr:MAG: MFS transporter [Gemmatimonadales bacterium]
MSETGVRLGLRENWKQFWLLVLVNAFVGAMVGLERTVLPLIAEEDFGMVARGAILSFIVTFGFVKAGTNFFAGRLGDLFGRRKVLIAGWLFGIPVPFLLMWAPSWSWIVFANVLLGVNQGLAWSTTVIMKIDLVGPKARGLAMGLNEFAGYLAVALAALGTGYVAEAFGLRPEPFYMGIAFVALGLGLTVLFVRETSEHVALEAREHADNLEDPTLGGTLSGREIFALASWRHPALFGASQAGLVTNFKDGLAWGLFPLFFVAGGLSVSQVGILTFIYPALWGILQLWTGGLSDRLGRKPLIVGGMLLQALALFIVAAGNGFWVWFVGSALLGAGTALVYPTLLASVADVAHPAWRGSAVGVYRLWRDSGYAFGAIVAGLLADLLGIAPAILAGGLLALISSALAWVRMPETLPGKGRSHGGSATTGAHPTAEDRGSPSTERKNP